MIEKDQASGAAKGFRIRGVPAPGPRPTQALCEQAVEEASPTLGEDHSHGAAGGHEGRAGIHSGSVRIQPAPLTMYETEDTHLIFPAHQDQGATRRSEARRGSEDDIRGSGASLEWLPEIGGRPRGIGAEQGWADDGDDGGKGMYWESLSKETTGAGSGGGPCSQARDACGRTPCCKTRRRGCMCCCSVVALIVSFVFGIALQVLSLVSYTKLRLHKVDVQDACSIPMVVALSLHIHNPSTVTLILSSMDITLRIRDKARLGVVRLAESLTVGSSQDMDISTKLLLEPDADLNVDLADTLFDPSSDYILDLNVDLMLELLGGLPLHFFFAQRIPLDFEGGGRVEEVEQPLVNSTVRNCSTECWFTTFENECCDPSRNVTVIPMSLAADLENTFDSSLSWLISEGGIASVRVPSIRLAAVQQSQARDGFEIHLRPMVLPTESSTGLEQTNAGTVRFVLVGHNGVDMLRAIIEGRVEERWELRVQESQITETEARHVCALQQALANVRWSFEAGQLMNLLTGSSIVADEASSLAEKMAVAFSSYRDNGANEMYLSMSFRNPLDANVMLKLPSIAVAVGSTPIPDRRVPEEAAFLSAVLDPLFFNWESGDRQAFTLTLQMLDAVRFGRTALGPIVNGQNISLRILGVNSTGGPLFLKVLQDSTYGMDFRIETIFGSGIRSILGFFTDLSIKDGEAPSSVSVALGWRTLAPGAKLFFQGTIPPISFRAVHDGRNVSDTSLQVSVGFLDISIEAKTQLLGVNKCNPLLTSMFFGKNFSPQVDVVLGTASPIPLMLEVPSDLLSASEPVWKPGDFSAVTVQGSSPCGILSGTASGEVCNRHASSLRYELRGFSSNVEYGEQRIASGWSVGINVPGPTCSPLPLSFDANSAYAATPEEESVCTSAASQGIEAPFSYSGAALDVGGVCACSRGIGGCSDGEGFACEAPTAHVRVCSEFEAAV